jgi:NAD(P)-dependent dehydrogenase (short-subunit alcohol dehydrogenase family)
LSFPFACEQGDNTAKQPGPKPMNEIDEKTGIADLLSLNGQRALVTGGSGNIGRGIAVRLAEAGADIVVHYHSDAAGAAQTVAAITAIGREATSLQANLADAGEVADMFAEIDATGSPAGCIVNNAGSYPVAPFAEISPSDWQQVVAANLDSAVHVSQEAIRRMRGQGGGAIVNIASIEGTDPAPGHSHYAASKAGLLMLTRSLTLEYGPLGIRTNAVSPGLIDREGIEQNWPEGVDRWRANVPLATMGDAADVANAVLFLLSPASRWISGANLVVDGGMSTVSRW